MISSTLFFTTLFASLAFVSADSTPVSITEPNLIECTNTTITWTAGQSQGPWDFYLFTDCSDPSTDPIATFTAVTGNSVNWYNTLLSGKGLFAQLTDSNGNDYYSDDWYVGGNGNGSAQYSACQASLSAVSTSSTATASLNAPTTLSKSSTTTAAGGGNGINNAAKAATAGSAAATATGSTSGAFSTVARPVGVIAGLMALAVASTL